MRREYGVRTEGGHKAAKLSRHVATREVEQLLAAGANPRNTYVVERDVTEWRPLGEPPHPGALAV